MEERPVPAASFDRQSRKTVVLREVPQIRSAATCTAADPPPTSEPQVHPVSVFLASLQLQGYVDAFVVEHGFRSLELIAMHIKDESDLIEIGVRPLAHRRTLMAAINKMRKSWIAGPGLQHQPKQSRQRKATTAAVVDELGRATVALPQTPNAMPSSFSQQLAAFRMHATKEGHITTPVEARTAGSDGPVDAAAAATLQPQRKEEYVVVLSAGTNAASIKGEGETKVGIDGVETDGHRGTTWAPHDAAEPSLTARDQLAEALAVTEAAYQTAMRQLKEDAEAAATSLSEQFTHRANAIEDNRQMHLEDIEQLCVHALSGTHHRHPTADEVVAALDDAVALSLRGTPSAVEATPAGWHRRGFVLQGCRVSIAVEPVWHPHPPPTTGTEVQRKSQRQPSGGVEVPSSAAPCPTPTRVPTRSASVRERSGTNRASLRRVEAWLEDNADVICLSPSLDDDAPSASTTQRQKAVAMPLSQQQHVIELLSSAEGGSAAMVPTPPNPENDANRNGDAIAVEDDDLILEHISCSQAVATNNRVPRQEDQASVVPPPRSAATAAVPSSAADVVDVDACSTDESDLSYAGGMECDYGMGASTFFCPADVSNSSESPGEAIGDATYVGAAGSGGSGNMSFSPVEMQPFETSILFPDDSNSMMSDECSRPVSLVGRNARLPPRTPVPHASERLTQGYREQGKAPLTQMQASPSSKPPLASNRADNAIPTSIVGRLWHTDAVPTAAIPFHKQHSLDAIHTMPLDELTSLCDAHGLGCAASGAGRPQKRPRDEEGLSLPELVHNSSNAEADAAASVLPRTALLTLYTRSLFLDATRQLLERVPAFSGQPVKGKRDASMSRLLQAEKDALTQTELNDVRRRIKEQEASEANDNIIASLVHDSMQSLMMRVHGGGGGAHQQSVPRLAVYEAALMREGVDMGTVESVVHADFPSVPKSRLEGLLKANGVPIDVVRHSPAAVKRHRYFTTKCGKLVKK